MVMTQLEAIRKNGYGHEPLETVRREGGEFPALIFWPPLANEYLVQMRSDPRLARIVEAILGPNVKQLNNQLSCRLPGDTDSFSWHQNMMFRSPRDQYPQVVEEDGDLDLVPETCEGLRGFEETRKAATFAHLEPRISPAEPGDVVVCPSRSVHGSAGNESDRSRVYYMNGFARSRNCKPWPNYLKRGRIKPPNPRRIP